MDDTGYRCRVELSMNIFDNSSHTAMIGSAKVYGVGRKSQNLPRFSPILTDSYTLR